MFSDEQLQQMKERPHVKQAFQELRDRARQLAREACAVREGLNLLDLIDQIQHLRGRRPCREAVEALREISMALTSCSALEILLKDVVSGMTQGMSHFAILNDWTHLYGKGEADAAAQATKQQEDAGRSV